MTLRIKRSTQEEKLQFFLELDHDLRMHPTHPAEQIEDMLPWSSHAIYTLLVLNPYRKRNFMRYTREKGKVGSIGPRLWRMWYMIQQHTNSKV
jgi:hypothetical protein